jgi:transposase-like protein
MKKLTELTLAQLAKRTEVPAKQTKLYDAKLRIILDTYISHERNALQTYRELGISKTTFFRLIKEAREKFEY